MAPGLQVVRFMFLSLILWACHSLPDSAISSESLQRQQQPLSDTEETLRSGAEKPRCWGKYTNFSMTVEKSYAPLQREEGKHLSCNMGEMLDLLLNWLGKHFHLYHYQQSMQCWELLWSFGTSWHSQAVPLHSLPSKASWGGSLLWTDSQIMLESQPFGKPLANLGQNQRGQYVFTIMDAEFLHLCPSVVNLLVSTVANEKEVHASQRS